MSNVETTTATPTPPAPDSMSLRSELVRRLNPGEGQLTQFEFEEAQKCLRSLRKLRQKLERLGMRFADLPPRGRHDHG